MKHPPKRGKKSQASAISLALIVAIVALLVYWNSLSGQFVWDDETQIIKNQTIRSFANITKAFTSSFWAFSPNYATASTNFYRPFQTLAYMLAYAAGGLSPRPFHALSVLFHVITCLGVLVLCLELEIPAMWATAGALWFAAHPVHTEAVAWIAGMPDVICGAFYVGGLWAGIRYFNRDDRIWLGLSAVFFLCALLAKEMAITLPVTLLLVVAVRKPEVLRDSKRLTRAGLPFVTAGAAYLVIRYLSLGVLATSHIQIAATWFDWLTLAVHCVVQYARYAIVPYPLVASHLIPIAFADRAATALMSVVVLALLVTALWLSRRLAPLIAALGASFVVTLAPVLFFKAISTTSFFAERYLYIPTVMAAVLVAVAGSRFPQRYGKSLQIAIAACVIAFGALTIWRNHDWNNDEKLYLSTLRYQPEVAAFRTSLADIYLKQNDDTLARAYLESALQFSGDKRFVQIPFELYRTQIGLAAVFIRAGKYEEGRSHLHKALEINPQGDWAYLYLGAIAMEGPQDYAEAVRQFKRAIELGPLNEVARDYLGAALFNQGDIGQAREQFQESLRINPSYRDAQIHLEMANQALRR